jgi:uncharacterized membrane protein YidH (DUF202 family)
MTSISVVAGNVPLALALEPGSSVRSSLGVVVIGGILSSLLLTLLLVPIMYLILAPEHFARLAPRRRRRATTPTRSTPTVTASSTAQPTPVSPPASVAFVILSPSMSF